MRALIRFVGRLAVSCGPTDGQWVTRSSTATRSDILRVLADLDRVRTCVHTQTHREGERGRREGGGSMRGSDTRLRAHTYTHTRERARTHTHCCCSLAPSHRTAEQQPYQNDNQSPYPALIDNPVARRALRRCGDRVSQRLRHLRNEEPGTMRMDDRSSAHPSVGSDSTSAPAPMEHAS